MLNPRFDIRPQKLLAAMRNIRNAVSDGAFRDALSQAGDELLTWLQREYRGRARRDWKRLSAVTVVLSRARVQNKIESWAQLRSAVRRAQPLIDTGRTYQSLVKGSPGNIFRVANSYVAVGSSSPELVANQRERTTIFNFDPDARARFEANVPRRVVRFRATGGRSRLSRRERGNDVYGPMLQILKKMDGKSFNVRARPLPTAPPGPIVARLRRNVALILKARWQATG